MIFRITWNSKGKKYCLIKYGKIFLINWNRQWAYQFIARLFTDTEFVMWDLKDNAEVLNHIDLDSIRNTEISNEVEEDDWCGT